MSLFIFFEVYKEFKKEFKKIAHGQSQEQALLSHWSKNDWLDLIYELFIYLLWAHWKKCSCSICNLMWCVFIILGATLNDQMKFNLIQLMWKFEKLHVRVSWVILPRCFSVLQLLYLTPFLPSARINSYFFFKIAWGDEKLTFTQYLPHARDWAKYFMFTF